MRSSASRLQVRARCARGRGRARFGGFFQRLRIEGLWLRARGRGRVRLVGFFQRLVCCLWKRKVDAAWRYRAVGALEAKCRVLGF